MAGEGIGIGLGDICCCCCCCCTWGRGDICVLVDICGDICWYWGRYWGLVAILLVANWAPELGCWGGLYICGEW